MFLTIFVFVAILALLVLVHELGHFLVSRRNGVPAEEFGFGFPPRIVGTYRDKEGRRKWVFGNKKIEEEVVAQEETVFSLNLIPLGGFVKIKGEDGQDRTDPKSFATQKVWTRFKILVAGVTMNFVLAIFLFALAFWIGLPEAIDDETSATEATIQISTVLPDSPAEKNGLRAGDKIVGFYQENKLLLIDKVGQLQSYLQENKGREVVAGVIHPGEKDITQLKITPRAEYPEDQGPLGISVVRTTFARYNPLEALWLGVKTSFSLIWAILVFLGDLLAKLFTAQPVPAEVAGPVGIAVLTGQVARMGLAFILQFAALLSINLAVINLLPLPALDGGRILFLLIEKIKGSPVSQKAEGIVHTAGFIFLMGLMLLVTWRDFINFEFVVKVKDLF